MIQIFFKFYRKLFGNLFFLKINKLLFYSSIRGLGIFNYENMDVSGEKHFIKNFLKKDALRKDKYIVFDVGANVGDYSRLIAENIINAHIFSFEPHPKTFEILKINTKDLQNIYIFNCALSSKKGKLELYDYKSNDSSPHSSFNKDIFKSIHKAKDINTYKVDVCTIDNFCSENNIEIIDFLKIDVEGYELDVLKGAKMMLDNCKIRCIQFEFTQINVYTKVFFKDFWDILSEKYRIYRLIPKSMYEIKKYDPTLCEIFGFQNFVAIHKENSYGI